MFNRSTVLFFYVGNPNAIDTATYSKLLMAPYTIKCKQSGPIMSWSSKPITDQDLAETLTLSQKDRLPDWKLSSFDKNPRQGHECFVSLKAQSMQEL